MYYLNPSKGKNIHGIFCWKRSEMEDSWKAYDKYGEQVRWPGMVNDALIGYWLHRNDKANLSYNVTFEKKEVWPKVAENGTYVAVFQNGKSFASHVYHKGTYVIDVGRFYTYQEWLNFTNAKEITGDTRTRWLKFFE